MFWVWFAVGALVCAVIGMAIAPSRGYSPAVGFFLCLFTGILGLIVMALVKGSLETPDEARARMLQEQQQAQWAAYAAWQQQNASHPFDGPR